MLEFSDLRTLLYGVQVVETWLQYVLYIVERFIFRLHPLKNPSKAGSSFNSSWKFGVEPPDMYLDRTVPWEVKADNSYVYFESSHYEVMFVNWAHYLVPKISFVLSYISNPLFIYSIHYNNQVLLGPYRYLLFFFAIFNMLASLTDLLVPVVSSLITDCLITNYTVCS